MPLSAEVISFSGQKQKNYLGFWLILFSKTVQEKDQQNHQRHQYESGDKKGF